MKMCGNCKRTYYSSLTIAEDMECYESKKQTNYERIRNMTIEEMHAFLIELDTNISSLIQLEIWL